MLQSLNKDLMITTSCVTVWTTLTLELSICAKYARLWLINVQTFVQKNKSNKQTYISFQRRQKTSKILRQT